MQTMLLSLINRAAERGLLVVGVVAVVARLAAFVLVYLIRNQSPAVVGGGDATAYMAMAHYVYASGEFSSPLFLSRPLLFPALAAALYHLFGEQVFPIILLNMLLNVVTCLLIYRLAETIGQRPQTALVAGLIAAAYPAMLLSSVSYMTDALLLFLFVLALLLFARFILAPNWLDLLNSTAAFTLASLTRLIILPISLLFIALIVRYSKAWWRYAAGFLLACILPAAILTYRNWYYSGIATVSTDGGWMLLFMRATSSERRATGEDTLAIYARYIQEIEQRLGHPVPPTDSIRPEAIWGYFQPTREAYAVISQMAIEKNLAYPQWYILNSFYGLHRILTTTPGEFALSSVISIPIYYAFVLLACVGLWTYWRHDRRWAWLLGLPVLVALGLTIALETAVLDTRHGLAAALPMFILSAQGIEVVARRVAVRPQALEQSGRAGT